MSAQHLNVKQYLGLIPSIKEVAHKMVWLSYDEEADTLYINFKKPSHADDSELTEDDILIRYEGKEIIGVTVLHASLRKT